MSGPLWYHQSRRVALLLVKHRCDAEAENAENLFSIGINEMSIINIGTVMRSTQVPKQFAYIVSAKIFFQRKENMSSYSTILCGVFFDSPISSSTSGLQLSRKHACARRKHRHARLSRVSQGARLEKLWVDILCALGGQTQPWKWP